VAWRSAYQESAVHRLANALGRTEREREVRHAARDAAARAAALDLGNGLEEVDGIVVVLLHAGTDRENVGVEDDGVGVHADLVDEDTERALADGNLAGLVDCLAFLVERHHDDGGAVLLDDLGVLDECSLAFLQAAFDHTHAHFIV